MLLKKNRSLVVLLLALLGGSPLVAQIQADTLRLSEAEALSVAVERNLSLKASKLGVAQARTDKRVNLSRLFPSIDLNGQYGYALKKQVVYFGGDAPSGGAMGGNPFASFMPSDGIEMGERHNISGGLQATMPLVNLQLWESLKLDRLSVEQALEKARSSEITLRNEVRKAYLAALFAEENARVLQLSLKTMEDNLADIKLKLDRGLVAEYDYVRMRTQRDNMKPTVSQAETQVRLSKMKLLILMDYDPAQPIRLSGNLLRDYEEATIEAHLGSEVLPSLEDNNTLRTLQLTLRQLEGGIKVKRMEYLPTLGLSFNYTYNFASDQLRLSNHRRWSPSSTIGLGLTIPLFSGGSTRYGIKSLELQRRQVILQKQETERQLALQLTSLLETCRQAAEQFDSSRQAEVSARKGLEIAQVRYKSGHGTLLELNDAELALRQAELSKSQAIYNLMVAQCDYDLLLGK